MTFWEQIVGRSPENLVALALSGAGGAYVRAVFDPAKHWRQRLLEGSAGAVSAIFLGGVVGHIVDAATGAGASAYLAAGFLMGEGGILLVHQLRRRVLGSDADRKEPSDG